MPPKKKHHHDSHPERQKLFNGDKLVEAQELILRNKLLSYVSRAIHSMNEKALDTIQSNPRFITALNNNEKTLQTILDSCLAIASKDKASHTLGRMLDFLKTLYPQDIWDVIAKKNGATMLQDAVWCNQLDNVKVLVAHGISINQQKKHGNTPIMTAIKAGNTDIAKFLLTEESINLELRDESGFSPILLAKALNNKDIVKELSRGKYNVKGHSVTINGQVYTCDTIPKLPMLKNTPPKVSSVGVLALDRGISNVITALFASDEHALREAKDLLCPFLLSKQLTHHVPPEATDACNALFFIRMSEVGHDKKLFQKIIDHCILSKEFVVAVEACTIAFTKGSQDNTEIAYYAVELCEQYKVE